jgi:hypothetical protein
MLWGLGVLGFHKIVTVTEVKTQGDGDYSNWIKSYKLKITTDGSNWTDVEGGKEYPSNTDKNTVVTNVLSVPV